jgi:hypothetical protein
LTKRGLLFLSHESTVCAADQYELPCIHLSLRAIAAGHL